MGPDPEAVPYPQGTHSFTPSPMRNLIIALTFAALTGTEARAQCLTTLFAANGGTSSGGAMYFDVDATRPLVVASLESNFLADSGTPVGVLVYVRSGTSVGFESSPSLWTLVSADDGTSTAGGFNVPTPIVLDPPILLPAGLTGVALVAVGTGHARTNGNGTNQVHNDGTLTITLGASSNAPFSGTTFTPRVWNGTLCYRPEIGARYCSPAVPNSSGVPASIHATGNLSIPANDVALTLLDLPAGSFALALTSTTTNSVPMAGGGQGTLCLGGGGSIGRFVHQVTPASPAGATSITVDLTAMPTPIALVPVLPGDTWSFQVWYRDANPSATSNFTDAVTLQF